MGKTVERDRLETSGVVVEASNGMFKVDVENNMIVLCTLSGRIRQNNVKILLGDIVKCELCEYDLGRGRIVFRLKS